MPGAGAGLSCDRPAGDVVAGAGWEAVTGHVEQRRSLSSLARGHRPPRSGSAVGVTLGQEPGVIRATARTTEPMQTVCWHRRKVSIRNSDNLLTTGGESARPAVRRRCGVRVSQPGLPVIRPRTCWLTSARAGRSVIVTGDGLLYPCAQVRGAGGVDGDGRAGCGPAAVVVGDAPAGDVQMAALGVTRTSSRLPGVMPRPVLASPFLA